MTKQRLRIWMLLGAIIPVGGCMDFQIPDPNVRYIAFGSSTTKGPSTRDYPDILRERLGEDPSTFANEGNSGEEIADAITRLQSLISRDIYPNATTLLIWHGGNDIINFIGKTDSLLIFSPNAANYPFEDQLDDALDIIQADIELEIGIAQDAGWEVYIATLYPIREQNGTCDPLPFNILLAPQAANANVYLRRLNDRIRLAAANTGAILVDIEAIEDEITESAANYFDCNHLSEAGNTIAAELFFTIISTQM